MANTECVKYKFISRKRFHAFIELCYSLKITIWVSKDDNNLNKRFKKWYRHIFITDEQKQQLSEFNHCVI